MLWFSVISLSDTWAAYAYNLQLAGFNDEPGNASSLLESLVAYEQIGNCEALDFWEISISKYINKDLQTWLLTG